MLEYLGYEQLPIMPRTYTNIIRTEAELRATLGHPARMVVDKALDRLDDHCRAFIQHSPFLTIASSDGEGRLDVSPKGDPPGFVRILDDRTLAIPDRPGNKRADTLTNVLRDPNVGLLFFIPGVRETLRVNGRATVVRDADLLQLRAVNGRPALFATVVEITEAFMHCAKCIIRSALWSASDAERPAGIPSLGTSLVKHARLPQTAAEMDELIREDERTNLY